MFLSQTATNTASWSEREKKNTYQAKCLFPCFYAIHRPCPLSFQSNRHVICGKKVKVSSRTHLISLKYRCVCKSIVDYKQKKDSHTHCELAWGLSLTLILDRATFRSTLPEGHTDRNIALSRIKSPLASSQCAGISVFEKQNITEQVMVGKQTFRN